MAEETPQPLKPFFEAQQEVRRLFQELVHQPWGGARLQATSSWQPTCDMDETDEAIIVEIDLPGVKREDVRVEVEGDVLRITGERRSNMERQEHNYHYLERRYGRFERQLHLPHTVDRAAIRAEFSEGVLIVTLPKSTASQVDTRAEKDPQ